MPKTIEGERKRWRGTSNIIKGDSSNDVVLYVHMMEASQKWLSHVILLVNMPWKNTSSNSSYYIILQFWNLIMDLNDERQIYVITIES